MIDKKKFFSLIELLTVMAVIAVLLGITIGIFSLVRDKMNNSKTRAIIKQLDIAMQSYKLDQGYYFSQSTGFFSKADTNYSNTYFKLNYNNSKDTAFIKCFEYQSLVGSKNILTQPGTTNEYVVDAWGNPVLYRYPGIFNPQMFDIGSLGRDGLYGSGSATDSNLFGQGDDITNFNNN